MPQLPIRPWVFMSLYWTGFVLNVVGSAMEPPLLPGSLLLAVNLLITGLHLVWVWQALRYAASRAPHSRAPDRLRIATWLGGASPFFLLVPMLSVPLDGRPHELSGAPAVAAAAFLILVFTALCFAAFGLSEAEGAAKPARYRTPYYTFMQLIFAPFFTAPFLYRRLQALDAALAPAAIEPA